MRKDSISKEITKEDIITMIKMELNADIHHELNIVLVEGPDDTKFCRRVLNEKVVCRESYAGKTGLHEIMKAKETQDSRVIAIRDKDYADLTQLGQRIFVYDGCCMEMMLLQSEDVREGFHDTYYNGRCGKDVYVTNAMRQLAPYSILRKNNEEQGWHIRFANVKMGDIFKPDDNIDMETLFLRLRRDGEPLDKWKENILGECQKEAQKYQDENLYEITNGHDMCNFLANFSKSDNKPMGEGNVRDALINAYRKSDFKETDLYDTLERYQSQNGQRYVD